MTEPIRTTRNRYGWLVSAALFVLASVILLVAHTDRVTVTAGVVFALATIAAVVVFIRRRPS